jgi:hypothetical protein
MVPLLCDGLVGTGGTEVALLSWDRILCGRMLTRRLCGQECRHILLSLEVFRFHRVQFEGIED